MDLEEEYTGLLEEINVGSLADSELKVTEFFRIFSSISAENGDSPDLEYNPILKEGLGGYRVDGYALDILDGDNTSSGDLYLAVSDFRQDADLPSINAKDVDRAVDGVERFFKAAASEKFLQNLEESSPAYQLALLLYEYVSRISRLRVILFTNGHLRTRRNIFETRKIGHVTLHINVLDLERYVKISTSGDESVEIDFDEDFTGAIRCLPASTGTDDYRSFLFAIPGSVLAEIFAAFGNRLLEQNVRTYLQARTNVNKGILRTISDEPGMFFAYNNGVTATASEVSTRQLDDNTLVISHIKDFQIVNGGQTTASLLYARDGQKRSLDHVYVQVKLSVVDIDRLDEVVPKISEYANTQNKVSLADLASNSPVQIKIERFSKEVSVPHGAGELHGKKWFYERARGQYKNLFAYKTPSERRKLELIYPKSHLVTKTDLGKYELSFDGRPHHVSEGAQKCFNRYSTTVLSKFGNSVKFSETWFKRAMAKTLLFTSLDSAIQKAEWYKFDRGYKAQIVTYTVAACAEGFRSLALQIDLDRIWKNQSIPDDLLNWMLVVSQDVAKILKTPPDNVRNITEYAKKEFCWEYYVKGKVGIPDNHISSFGIRLDDYNDETIAGAREEKQNRDIDFDVLLLNLIPKANDIKSDASARGLASPKNISALEKLMSGRLNLNKGEKNALKYLLERMEIEL